MSDRKKISFPLIAAPAAFALLCGAYIGMDSFLSAKERRIRAEWNSLVPAEIRGEINAPAQELISLAFPLGIDLRPVNVALSDPPDFSVRSAQFEKIWEELNHYVKAEALIPGPPDEIPEQSLKLLVDWQQNLSEVEKHLVASDPPEWCAPPERENRYLTSLRGIIRLHHLIAADAIYHLKQADPDRSQRALAACWQLNESIRHRHESISLLVAIKCSSIQMGLVRKLPSIPIDWKARARSLDYRKIMTAALAAEATHVFDVLNEKSTRVQVMAGGLRSLPEWGRPPAAALMDPYFRLCRLNYLSFEMELIRSLEKGSRPVRFPSPGALMADYIHEYDFTNTTLLEFERKRQQLLQH